ncbi:aromatic acid exporter family protein [Streptomyces sp. LRE541]|uniref:aromatic acid exporter family protein n=1 Tax=Streptomyces sp. LRE541 TaxID=2931983 RepID=UPI0020103B05|nr:aromatic acid exporter family protein [Streptomyces sp. LRE541]UPZ32704.1 aromatic acid exporter family protein [Streptomyces sp. LRE541]
MWNALIREAAAVGRSVRRCFTESGPERETAVQSLKAAGAALLAWALAGWWWNAPMALLAPWTALFLVQSTVYRSLLTALQQVVVVVTGTLLATAALALTHDTMAAMALALPLTVLLGNYARLGTQGLYAPTAALFVLAYGTYSGFDILHRLLETLLGAAIGITVNATVLPPVHSGRVHHLRARLPRDCARLLHEVADGIETSYDEERARGWYDSAVRLADEVTKLRTARRWSDESHRFNPGRRMRRSAAAPPSAEWDFTWDRITEHIRAITRSLSEAVSYPESALGVPGILSPLLRAAGDVLDCRDGADDGHHRARRALQAAVAAHGRLAAVLAEGRREAMPALGGLTADTERLLDDLTMVVDSWDDDATEGRARSSPRA